nr:MAG TPA: holin family protein [Caudoviricetes sp.]
MLWIYYDNIAYQSIKEIGKRGPFGALFFFFYIIFLRKIVESAFGRGLRPEIFFEPF